MTFNTGNPIGSTDARDLSDNAENFDHLENSTTKLTHSDRLGTVRKTRHGMEVEHDAQIAAHETEHDAQMRSFENDFDGRLVGMAFTRVGSFTTGATLTDMRQTLEYSGHEYSWAGTFPKVVAAGATPATSGGIGAGAWVDRTDVTLRNDINIVQKLFTCVADMVSDTSLTVGKIVETIGYYNDWVGTNDKPKGGNRYEIVAGGTGTVDGGSFIALSTGLQAKGLFVDGVINPYQFGAKGGGTTNDSSSILACHNYGSTTSKVISYLKDVYLVNGDLPSFIVNFNHSTLKGSPRIVVYSSNSNISNVTYDANGADISRFILLNTTCSNVVISDVLVKNVASTTFIRAVSLEADNCDSITIRNVCLKDSTCLANGIIGDVNGSMRSVYIGAINNVSSVNPTFTNSTIENSSMVNCYNLSSTTGTHVIEDADAVSIQCNTIFELNSIIRGVVAHNGAKRSLKLQCSGVSFYDISFLVDNPSGVLLDADNFAFAAVSIYGNNIKGHNVSSNSYSILLDIKDSENVLLDVLTHVNSNTGSKNSTGASAPYNSTIRLSGHYKNIQIDGVIVNNTEIPLISSIDTNGLACSDVGLKNVIGKSGGGFALFRDSISEATNSVSDIYFDNINLDIDTTYTDSFPAYFASADNVHITNSKITVVKKYYSMLRNNFKLNLHNSEINESITPSTVILGTFVGYCDASDIKTNAKTFGGFSSTNGAKLRNIVGNNTSGGICADTSDGSNLDIIDVTGFPIALKARGTTTTGITLRDHKGTIDWYVNSSSIYTPAQLKVANRRATEYSAAPTTSTWSVGDIVMNTAPSAGGYVGWVCVSSGTPGTWKGFGLIAS